MKNTIVFMIFFLFSAIVSACTAVPPSSTPTATSSFTPSATATATPTSTSTYTPTLTSTYTATPTSTLTYTPTSTFTPSATNTHTPTATPTNTPTRTPTRTPTATPQPLGVNVVLEVADSLSESDIQAFVDAVPNYWIASQSRNARYTIRIEGIAGSSKRCGPYGFTAHITYQRIDVLTTITDLTTNAEIESERFSGGRLPTTCPSSATFTTVNGIPLSKTEPILPTVTEFRTWLSNVLVLLPGLPSTPTPTPSRTPTAIPTVPPDISLIITGNTRFDRAAFSPDAQFIVTTSLNQVRFRIWDVNTGNFITDGPGISAWPNSLIYTNDGRLAVLVTTGGSTIKVLDARENSEIVSMQGHRGPVLFATFSPDGTKVISTSSDNTVRVWDVASGDEMLQLPMESMATRAVYSPNGLFILTANIDDTARIWNVQTGELTEELVGHSASLTSASYSSDSRLIVTSSEDDTARIWNAESGSLVVELIGHESDVNSASFSFDGMFVVTASDDGSARVWNAETGLEVKHFSGDRGKVFSAVFSLDGSKVLTAHERGAALRWLTNSG